MRGMYLGPSIHAAFKIGDALAQLDVEIDYLGPAQIVSACSSLPFRVSREGVIRIIAV